MWPFKTEDRAQNGFTDLFVSQLLAQAGGNVYADVSNTAAAELCSGLWGRAFASAELSPAIPGIGPDTLESIARALILGGEYWGPSTSITAGYGSYKPTHGTSPAVPIHGAGTTPSNYRGLRETRAGAFRRTG